jgi:RNA polymerase sigma factor (sigma-70 family)
MPADLQILVRHIRRLAGRELLGADCDRGLLERYTRDRDEAAFAILVGRHAPLVAGVCRRVLSNTQDVEDAFQATFLLLARKASSCRWQDSVANWLHGVAYRIALRARADACRRLKKEQGAAAVQTSTRSERVREIQELLDEELERLPSAERTALTLCYLEGRTRDEAARQCSWSLRTIERRLERGRNLLRSRLARRGFEFSGVMLAAALGEQSSGAAERLTALAMQCVHDHAGVSTGLATGAQFLRLAEVGLPVAGASYLKMGAGILLVCVFTGAAAIYRGQSHGPATPEADHEPLGLAPAAEQVKDDRSRLDEFGDPLPPGAVARLGTERFRVSGASKIAYSLDGKKLVVCEPNSFVAFDSVSGRVLKRVVVTDSYRGHLAAISSDARLVAFADPEGASPGSVYDADTGRKLCELQTPAGRTCRLSGFSRDGKLLAAWVSLVCLDLYEIATGKLVRTLEWEENYMPPSNYTKFWGEIGFLADGRSLIASIHHTGMIRAFDLNSGMETRHILVSPHGLARSLLSPDGSRLIALPCVGGEKRATGFRNTSDESILVFDAATGERKAELVVPNLIQYFLVLGPDNRTLISGIERERQPMANGRNLAELGVWNLATGRKIGKVPFGMQGRGMSTPLTISPDGKIFCSPSESSISQVEIATGKEAVSVRGAVPIEILAVEPSGGKIATWARDQTVRLWDRESGKHQSQFGGLVPDVCALQFGADAQKLFVLSSGNRIFFNRRGGAGETVRALSIPDYKEAWIWQSKEPQPASFPWRAKMVLAPQGGVLAVRGLEGVVMLDTVTGNRVSSWPAANMPLSDTLAYSADGNRLYQWEEWIGSGMQQTWKLTDGKFSNSREQTVTKQNTVLQSPDIAKAIGFLDGGENPELELARSRCHAAYSPNGQYLAICGDLTDFALIDTATAREVRRIKRANGDEGKSIRIMAFSPDGNWLAWGGPADGVVRMIDVASGETRRRLAGHTGGATELSFSKDGSTLVAGCSDGTALVWDVR